MYSYPALRRLPAVGAHSSFSYLMAFANCLLLMLIVGRTLNQRFMWLSNTNRLVAIVLVVVYLLCHFQRRLKMVPEVILFGLFILWAATSGLLVATETGPVMHYLRWLFQSWPLVLAMVGLCVAQKNAAMNFFILAATALLLVAYARLTGDHTLSTRAASTSRAMSLMTNPNHFGFMILYGMIGLAYLWGTTKRLSIRLALPLVFCVFAVALVTSASRKSFVVLLAFMVLWLWYCYRRQLFQKVYVVFFIVAVAVGMYCLVDYTLSGSAMGERLVRALESPGLGETRTTLYLRAWELFKENPVAGVGLGNFVVVSGTGLYAHSESMEILSTTGIVGFVLYFSIYLVLWRRLRRIGKLTSDPEVLYRLGFFKAVVLSLLCLGLGASNFLSEFHWFVLAGVIGSSYAMDASLKNRRTGRTLVPISGSAKPRPRPA